MTKIDMTSSLRIAMATPRAFPELGGIEAHVDEVAARLSTMGHYVDVLTTDRSGVLPAVTHRSGFTVRRFKAFPKDKDFYICPGLGWAIIRGKYDIVHLQGINTLVPPVVMAACLLRGVPFLVTFHTGGATNELRGRLRGLQFKLLSPLIRRAGAVVAVSDFEAQIFRPLLKGRADMLKVIRNGGLEVSDTPAKVDRDLILSIGRLVEYKGHHRAIAALAVLRQTNPNARLLILGSGPFRNELLMIAAQHGVGDHVEIRFIATEDRAEMVSVVSSAGVVVLLSDYEAHPVAVMEAVALGRPAVVFDSTGMAELVRQGWVKGVSPAASDREVANAIAGASEGFRAIDPTLLPNWQNCAESVEEAYTAIIDRVG